MSLVCLVNMGRDIGLIGHACILLVMCIVQYEGYIGVVGMEFQQSKLTAVTLLGKWVCLEPVRRLNTPALPSSLLLYRVKCGIVLMWQLDQFGGLERPLHYIASPLHAARNPCKTELVHVCVHLYVAVPRQDSMSPVRANAALSGYCNRFVGYP